MLDEATSSLDNRTEKIILKSLANFSNKKTIIMIAHRLTTVKNCDNIFYLDKGNIIAQVISSTNEIKRIPIIFVDLSLNYE